MMEKKKSPIQQGISFRAWLVYGAFVVFGIVILGRILYIQYGPESESRRAEAKGSRTFRWAVQEAERGDILAYDGRLLATSSPYYELRMDFKATGLTDSLFNHYVDTLSECMSRFFGDKSKQQYKNMFVSTRDKANRGSQRVFRIAPRQVSYYELNRIKEFPLFRHPNPNVSGFQAEKINKRVLPYGSIAQRTIGRRMSDSLKWGIEGAFDQELKGHDGQTRMQRISGSFWIPINDENNLEPRNGYDIVTTIDIELQDVAERALRQQLQETRADWGTAILMEVETGEIRAMANLSRRSDGTCVEDMNHAIAQRINPGSTFKLANLIVLLEDAGMSLDDVIDINYGRKRVGPRIVEDSHAGPKTLTLREVFLESSNVGFAQAVYDNYRDSSARSKVNQQRYVEQLNRVGVRDTLPFQIEGHRGPLVHDTQASTWSDWSLPSMAYGYELEMTPIQTLCLYNAVANGGRMVAPLLIKELQQYGQTVKTYKPQVLRQQISSPETIRLVQDCLTGVATEGTAKRLQIQDLPIAVKTGTAQIPNQNKGFGRIGDMNYLATLAGYFPADNPKYSLIVAIKTYMGQGGGSVYYGGSLAGPVFRTIAERVYGTSIDWKPVVAEQMAKTEEFPQVKGGDPGEITRVLDRFSVPYRPEGRKDDVATVRSDSTGMYLVFRETDPELVPDVIGMGLSDAVRLLEEKGMAVTFSGKGAVSRQSLAAGSSITRGQPVHLTLTTRN